MIFAIYLSTDFLGFYLSDFEPLILFEMRAFVWAANGSAMLLGPHNTAFETHQSTIFKICATLYRFIFPFFSPILCGIFSPFVCAWRRGTQAVGGRSPRCRFACAVPCRACR
jgi:hypothetical protein